MVFLFISAAVVVSSQNKFSNLFTKTNDSNYFFKITQQNALESRTKAIMGHIMIRRLLNFILENQVTI